MEQVRGLCKGSFIFNINPMSQGSGKKQFDDLKERTKGTPILKTNVTDKHFLKI
jgi:hypothetical protein